MVPHRLPRVKAEELEDQVNPVQLHERLHQFFVGLSRPGKVDPRQKRRLHSAQQQGRYLAQLGTA